MIRLKRRAAVSPPSRVTGYWRARWDLPLTSVSEITPVAGTWETGSGYVRVATAADADEYAVLPDIDIGSQTYTAYAVDVYMEANGTSYERAGFQTAWNGSDIIGRPYPYLQLYGSDWRVCVDSTGVLPRGSAPVQTAPNTWYRLGVTNFNGTMKVYLDGVYRMTANVSMEMLDGSYDRVGLHVRDCPARFRNLKVWTCNENPGDTLPDGFGV